ncbi:hypothetical protein H7142_03530 [Candidatus Saccharibacteria bacterium]|nr:hypothetical protein [Candidatus Saccharibacteria bacterium]
MGDNYDMPYKRKHIKIVKSKKKKDIIDRLIYPAAIATPLMTLPQLYIIWVDKDTGASVITWASYSVIALIWLLRARLKRKTSPSSYLSCLH